MNKSKSANNISVKKSQSYSRFLVQKKTFLVTVKKILNVTRNSLLIDGFSDDPRQHEEISLQDIVSIQKSQRNDTEFSIVSQKNEVTNLFCTDRIRCLSEIYCAWDKYSGNESPSPTKNSSKFEVSKILMPEKHDLQVEIDFIIYRAHIELVHKSLSCMSDNENKFIEIKNADSVVNSLTIIPYYAIGKIYKTQIGIIIEMKDSQVQHRIIFCDLEVVNNLLQKMQDNCKEYIGAQLKIINQESNEILVPEYVPARVYQQFFFKTKVYRVIESGHFFPLEIALSENYLIEIDINTGIVMQKLKLSTIKYTILQLTGLRGVQLAFEDKTIVTYVPLHDDGNLLIFNIFTLSSWKKPDYGFLSLQEEFLHSTTPNFQYFIHAWPEGIELEFETELIKKFTYSTNEDQLYQIMQEFNLNATLKNYNDENAQPLQLLMHFFSKNVNIILSNEFLAFWEAYQAYLETFYPIGVVKSDSEEDIKTILASHEDNLRHLNDKFLSQQKTNKNTPMTLNKQAAPLLIHKTEELLKGIIILVSSKPLFKEIANNKETQQKYENFLLDVTRLLGSPFPTLNHLAGLFFHTFCRFSIPGEKKIESMNKKFALTSKVKLMKKISETVAKGTLVKNSNVEYHENFSTPSILACLHILKAFLHDRKDTTNPEDLEMIYEYIAKAYYFIAFNFLFRYKSIACVYDTTIILNSFFQNVNSVEICKSYQKRSLNNSSIILRHIELAISSPTIFQRKVSLVLLFHLFTENPNACQLCCRIFPNYLFKKVESATNDISKWTVIQWDQFFSKVLDNFDTPTEQWNEECREELLTNLRLIDEGISSKLSYCSPDRLNELLESNNNGEFLLSVRWNHEEFEVKYKILENKFYVWKYYLTNLIEDSATPKLLVPIHNPAKLWNELHIRFPEARNTIEMRTILKVMILLYQQYYNEIKEFITMGYWLRCLTGPEFISCRYLILQLLYASITLKDQAIVKFNVEKFVNVSGVKILSDALNTLFFEENHNNLTQENIEELQNRENPERIIYNFTKLDIKKQAYSSSLEKAAMIFLIINIYKSILYRPIDKTQMLDDKPLYPMSVTKAQILDISSVKSLLNVLLIKDDTLVLGALDLFTEYLSDKFTFRSLVDNTPLYEFLLVNITQSSTKPRFNIALKIYKRIITEKFSDEDPIRKYSGFALQLVPPELISDTIKIFPLFKYFPKHLIWRLISAGVEEAVNLYWSESYETPEIIWNRDMREKLAECMDDQVHEYKHQLLKFGEMYEIAHKREVPQYVIGSTEVVYQNLLEEVKAGPVILRVWTESSSKNFELSQDIVPIFLENLFALLKKYATIQIPQASRKQLKDLLVILKAHAKAIKVYNLTKYECFKEILGILNCFSSRLAEEDLSQFHSETLAEMSQFILILCRILYRGLSLEKSENPHLFREANGVETIIFILQSMVRKISVVTANSPDPEEYYTDLSPCYDDLKILDLIIRMIQRVFVCYPSHFIVLESEKKLEIFLSLQNVSKIPLILFELIKTQTEKSPTSKIDQTNGQEPDEINIANEEQEQYDPNSLSIFDLILSEPQSSNSEKYCSKIFALFKNLVDLISEFSVKIDFSASFIQSGIAWRCLEFVTYCGDIVPTIKKIYKESSQMILSSIEKTCNSFRNTLIYSSEAFIRKGAGGLTSSSSSGLTSKERSPKPKHVQALSKIDNSEKSVLIHFQGAVLNILGKHLLHLILADHVDPITKPEGKDRANIHSFLKVFSTNLHDLKTLWNSETRQELKCLLVDQILDINRSQGKSYINLIENFTYTLHQKHLIVDEIFVSLYNKAPESKLINPSQFLLKIMKSVNNLWLTLQNFDQDPLLNDTENNLSSILFKLNEATAAIFNVIKHHGFEETLLSEEILSQLGLLLNEKHLIRIKDPYLNTLKSTCLDIFLKLSEKAEGLVKILENANILKSMIGLLRSNTKESSSLNQKIVKILESFCQEDSWTRILINYGFFVFLFESCLKSEIHPAIYRREVFLFVLRIIKDLPLNHLFNKLIISLFPDSIQDVNFFKIIIKHLKLLYGKEKSDTILEILDIGYNTPKIMWTKLMRHEVLLLLTIEGDAIQERWEKFQHNEIKLSDNVVFWSELHNKMFPIFPELQENLCIANIYLKNFNKDPKFDKEDNIGTFMNEVANHGLKIFDEFLNKTIIYETSGKSPYQATMSLEDQKEFDRLSYQMVTLLTSLLLSLDKILIGDKQDRKSTEIIFKPHQDNLSEEEYDPTNSFQTNSLQENVLISDNVIALIAKSMEFFNHLKIHLHILTTELQLIYLMIGDEKALNVLKKNKLVPTLGKLLKVIAKNEISQTPFTFVEEKLILYTLIKAMLKDQEIVSDAIDECAFSLRELLLSDKDYLKEIVQNCITVIVRDPSRGKDTFTQINEEEEVISVETVYHCSPQNILRSVWKNLTNPSKDNLLKSLSERSPDSEITYPTISEFAFVSTPHPRGENFKAEQNVKQHIMRIMEEYNNSTDYFNQQ